MTALDGYDGRYHCPGFTMQVIHFLQLVKYLLRYRNGMIVMIFLHNVNIFKHLSDRHRNDIGMNFTEVDFFGISCRIRWLESST